MVSQNTINRNTYSAPNAYNNSNFINGYNYNVKIYRTDLHGEIIISYKNKLSF